MGTPKQVPLILGNHHLDNDLPTSASTLVDFAPSAVQSETLGGPHPVMVTIRDDKEYIKVLLQSYYTTITG